MLAHNGDIQVHLRARCTTEAEAMALLAEVGGQIEVLLGDRIYSRNGDPLEATVGEMLAKTARDARGRGERDGGWPRGADHQRARSSDYFLGGFITYTRR